MATLAEIKAAAGKALDDFLAIAPCPPTTKMTSELRLHEAHLAENKELHAKLRNAYIDASQAFYSQ